MLENLTEEEKVRIEKASKFMDEVREKTIEFNHQFFDETDSISTGDAMIIGSIFLEVALANFAMIGFNPTDLFFDMYKDKVVAKRGLDEDQQN